MAQEECAFDCGAIEPQRISPRLGQRGCRAIDIPAETRAEQAGLSGNLSAAQGKIAAGDNPVAVKGCFTWPKPFPRYS